MTRHPVDWDALVTVGRIARTHGLRGQVVVNPETDFVEARYRVGAQVWLTRGDGPEAFRVAEVRVHQGRPILRFEGVESIEAAEALGRGDLRADPLTFDPLPAGTFRHSDLVGCEVRTAAGETVGRVVRVDGVWLAPLLVDEDSATATAHPEWMVGGASFKHSKNGNMRVLDVTHPEAAKHLGQVITQIVGWGYDLLKIDFLFAGTFEGQRAEPVQPMEAYARALQIIRDAAGEDTLLLAVGSPGLASLPFVDGWRVGGDIAFQVSDVAWAFLPSQARSVAARWPLCRATACDADPVMLRKLEPHEVDAGGYIAAFAGGALFLSDDLRALPVERRALGLDAERAAWALSKRPAVPQDPFPETPPETLANVIVDLISKQTSHVVPSVWKSEDGTEILLNVSDEPRNIRGVEVGAHSAKVR